MNELKFGIILKHGYWKLEIGGEIKVENFHSADSVGC